MNCRPGDLAVVLRSGEVIPEGAIVRCLSFIGDCLYLIGRQGSNVWAVEYRGATGCEDFKFGIPDVYLRPIRNPGDDAVDETLIYVGDPRVREAVL